MEKVYLILGASSDLGYALMKELAEKNEENITIFAHYHSSCERIDVLASTYVNLTIHSIKADLSMLSETSALIETIQKTGLVPSHIISFSASIYKFNRFIEFSPERISKEMYIQVYSFGMICRAFLPNMVENKNGKIVAMLSSATKGVPPKNTTEYTIVKYALLGLVKSLAADYGDLGVNINAVSPGMIETKFLKGIGRKIKEFTAEKNPQHRNLTVDDVVPTIMMLLSENCRFMNGTNINLSGFPE